MSCLTNKAKRNSCKKIALMPIWVTPTLKSIALPAHAQTSCSLIIPNNCTRLEGSQEIPDLDPIFLVFKIDAFFIPNECRLQYDFIDFDAILIADEVIIGANNSFDIRHEEVDLFSTRDEVYEFSGEIRNLSNGSLEIRGAMRYQDNIAGRSNSVAVQIPLVCV